MRHYAIFSSVKIGEWVHRFRKEGYVRFTVRTLLEEIYPISNEMYHNVYLSEMIKPGTTHNYPEYKTYEEPICIMFTPSKTKIINGEKIFRTINCHIPEKFETSEILPYKISDDLDWYTKGKEYHLPERVMNEWLSRWFINWEKTFNRPYDNWCYDTTILSILEEGLD